MAEAGFAVTHLYGLTETYGPAVVNEWQDEWRYEETSINWRSVIIWGLVIYFLFFRRKRKNKKWR